MIAGYGQSLKQYEDCGPPPLLTGLRQEMAALTVSLRNLGVLEAWKAIAEGARAEARAARKKSNKPLPPPEDESEETEPATDLTALAYIAGTIEGAIGLVVAQHTAHVTQGLMRLWAWLHDGAPYVELPGVDSEKLCASAAAAVQEHLGFSMRFRMKDMVPDDNDRAQLRALLAAAHQWPDMGSPSLSTAGANCSPAKGTLDIYSSRDTALSKTLEFSTAFWEMSTLRNYNWEPTDLDHTLSCWRYLSRTLTRPPAGGI